MRMDFSARGHVLSEHVCVHAYNYSSCEKNVSKISSPFTV